jgi:hypothetical protein
VVNERCISTGFVVKSSVNVSPSPAAINSESENDEYVCVICLFLKGKHLEKYMVLNIKMGNGKLG